MNMKKIFATFLIIISVFTFTSCNNEEKQVRIMEKAIMNVMDSIQKQEAEKESLQIKEAQTEQQRIDSLKQLFAAGLI